MANRTIKELLQLTLDQLIVEKDLYGICGEAWRLYNSDIINVEEWVNLKGWLRNHLPPQNYPKQPKFKWKPGTKACRIKWLTKQINSL